MEKQLKYLKSLKNLRVKGFITKKEYKKELNWYRKTIKKG